jgi:hypothetical protein
VRRILTAVLCTLAGATLLAQQSLIESAFVLNVEVPVRVFHEGEFVDDLTLADFVVLENGVKQKLDAVYLVRSKTVARRDEKRAFTPDTSRTFYLFFEVREYTRRLHAAIGYFMQNVFLPDDDLILISPGKTFRLRDIAKEARTREEILQEIRELLRPGAVLGNTEFRTTLADMAEITREIRSFFQILTGDQEGELDPGELTYMKNKLLVDYVGLTTRLQTLRQADEMRLLDLARYLDRKAGQNFVFMFYEKKLIPQLDPYLWERLVNMLDTTEYTQSLVEQKIGSNIREEYLDHTKIARAFADTSTSVHFLHVSPIQANIPDMVMREAGSETFRVLASIASATGGYAASSTDPETLFKSALAASENYYLLYYTPREYIGDGKFKYIKVDVKRQGIKVSHRMGYFAD